MAGPMVPKTIFLSEPGVKLGFREGYFIIRDGHGFRHRVGCARIEKFIVTRSIAVSSKALAAAMRLGIPLTILGKNSSLLGSVSPRKGRDPLARLAQYRTRRDEGSRLLVAVRLVEAKVRNSIRVVSRFKYNHREVDVEASLRGMKKGLKSVPSSTGTAEAMGHEGICARYYIEAFSRMVPDEMAFSGRSRRPPRDPVNALLSFGYTVLAREMAGVLEAEGLDPYVGFLHELKAGRPSLALDLIEPLRPCIVDRLILKLVNKRIITRRDFREDVSGEEGMVLLNREGRAKFFDHYEQWMRAAAGPDLSDGFWFGRVALCREAENFRRAVVSGELENWRPESFD